MARILLTVLLALAWAAGAAGLGFAVNALRNKSLPLWAPFPYEHDCPEKLELSMPFVDAPKAWKLARSQRLQAAGQRMVFVDARPEEAFAESHLRDARSFPYSFIAPFSLEDARTLQGFSHVFVYCDSPGDKLAGLQAELMRKAGMQQVKVVQGGFAALAKVAGTAQVTRGPAGDSGAPRVDGGASRHDARGAPRMDGGASRGRDGGGAR